MLPILVGLRSGVLAAALAAAAGGAAAKTIAVRIHDLRFDPATVTAGPGDTLEWTNGDFVAHTATARNGAFDVAIPPHAVRSIVLERAGSIDYFCRYHPTMKASIVAPRE